VWSSVVDECRPHWWRDAARRGRGGRGVDEAGAATPGGRRGGRDAELIVG
jgi:hypothetical protein